MNTPMQERLQRMSYSELRKIARKSGINGKQKAKDLIASILESAGSADDSFIALELQIMNSCNENKIKKFEEDMGTPSDTPRRDTYTIDDPADISMAMGNDLISSSASPVLNKTPEEHNTSITLTRGSVKMSKKRKVSFVTPIRRSARLSCLTPQFSSVKDRPKTPIPSRASSGRKGRVSSNAATKMFSGSLFISNSARKSSEGGRRPSTPMPKPKPKRMKLSSPGLLETPADTPVSTPVASNSSPSEQKQLMKLTPKSTSKSALTPATLSNSKGRSSPRLSTTKSALTPARLSITKGRSSPRLSAVKRSVLLLNSKQKSGSTPVSQLKKTPLQLSSVKDKRITPKSQLKNTPLKLPSVKVQRISPRSQLKKTPLQSSSVKTKKNTPNFNKLHQKQFDKMESIDEYIKRKQMNSTKKIHEQKKLQDSSKKVAFKKNSRIPKKFDGIPFVPTITSTSDMKTTFGFKTMKLNLTPGKRLPAVKFGKHNDSIITKKMKGEAKALKPMPKENTPLQKRPNTPLQKRFDLKASLSRKLTYKPHKGPLKPLGQVNLNASIFASAPVPPPKKVAPENRVIKAKRTEIRGVLHGVRKNKRFELQMKNRKP